MARDKELAGALGEWLCFIVRGAAASPSCIAQLIDGVKSFAGEKVHGRELGGGAAMKKAEELELVRAGSRVRPELDAASVCVGCRGAWPWAGTSRAKALTVAVWDKCKNPVVTWRFCGDYWIGELRKKPENNFKKDFSPKRNLGKKGG